MAGATGACNSGKMTLTNGQRPESTDEDRATQGLRQHDRERGVGCQVYRLLCLHTGTVNKPLHKHPRSLAERKNTRSQTIDKHIAVHAVDINGPSALWLAARWESLQLVRRLWGVAAKRLCVLPANMGEVRSHSVITAAIIAPPSEPAELGE